MAPTPEKLYVLLSVAWLQLKVPAVDPAMRGMIEMSAAGECERVGQARASRREEQEKGDYLPEGSVHRDALLPHEGLWRFR